ncbi:UBA/THIF-type NAD/FAD binding protein [Methanococcus vannielii SB]|jgi:molybdopterin/thiamine biosynthesis adenylyltransferase|uniref:UBA/THIF-type NAD/FAD binding protein n=1 Tax=Methanococcus vannielii (strain ATCC 35089 / DSM 1224 / JCM 13029 / OCM 148 / SB) TaxID=406327 RepID=A6UPN3_METVS|nr:HesA/MoeB/ThiF family protein [Methanococcus vannielii]ABR54455.1 UBA/THIF-type NAD/FAD binding protein [Methanococcus vannielii SB]
MNFERYKRQIIMDNFGINSQEKLYNSKVTVIGVGGLGTVVSQYLVAAGIGNLGLIDYQEVEISNLNRQILHFEKNIGNLKVVSAKEKLESLNSEVNIKIYPEKLKESHIKDSDIVIDCLDNFKARYFLNELSIKYDIPLVHGAIEGLRGQVTTLVPKETPCIECIFKLDDENKTFPVLGVTPGIIGSIQASEAIKLITGIGKPLKNKLLSIDIENNDYFTFNLKKNENCKACGDLND